MHNFFPKTPIKAGIVGTGYAASKRAEALQADSRSQLIAVSGNIQSKTADFAQLYGIESIADWQKLVTHPELDLVFICNINQQHGKIAEAALKAHKHVVVEYPLALEATTAASLIDLAQQQNKLLHVEHIELLGGVHRAIRQYLPEIGQVFAARYSTITPQHPAPRRWTYHHQMFGFPLAAALSRVHRFTDLFGKVKTVSCQTRFWDAPEAGYYLSCFTQAQLSFYNGVIATVTYGKGDNFWQGDRTFELHGEQGSLLFVGETGTLIKKGETISLSVESRRGLFAQDTTMVLDYLVSRTPLYLKPTASQYALAVANAASESATTQQTIHLS